MRTTINANIAVHEVEVALHSSLEINDSLFGECPQYRSSIGVALVDIISQVTLETTRVVVERIARWRADNSSSRQGELLRSEVYLPVLERS